MCHGQSIVYGFLRLTINTINRGSLWWVLQPIWLGRGPSPLVYTATQLLTMAHIARTRAEDLIVSCVSRTFQLRFFRIPVWDSALTPGKAEKVVKNAYEMPFPHFIIAVRCLFLILLGDRRTWCKHVQAFMQLTASPALLCILLVQDFLGSAECAAAQINAHCYQDEFGSWRSRRSTQGVQEREFVWICASV